MGSVFRQFSRLFNAQRRWMSTERQLPEHAVISTFDLFSIGVGPSSSHTVGPMRAGKIFINDLKELGVLEKVRKVKITLYGSLAATGKGHHTPQAILLGLEGSDPETIDPPTITPRYTSILSSSLLCLGGTHTIPFTASSDLLFQSTISLPTHPNGMRFSVFDEAGDLLATNEYFSVGGGFVVNERTRTGEENLYYKGVDKRGVHGARLHHGLVAINPPHESDVLSSSLANNENPSVNATNIVDTCISTPTGEEDKEHDPPYPFSSGNSLLALTRKHNMTIAQIVWDNEKAFGYSDDDILAKIMRIWNVMDECILTGVTSSETTLPGRLGLRRRAPMLYKRLMRGFYPGITSHNPTFPQITTPDSRTRELFAPNDEILKGLPTQEDAAMLLASRSKGSVDLGSNPRTNAKGFGSNGKAINTASRATRVVGSFEHAVLPMPPRKTVIPAMDFLSCYAIAVNEVNAAGGRIVTSPTNGAAGVIPAVLKYILEFVSDDHEKSVVTFLFTAAAVGMLFKRGSTISAAEGGCQAEVGVACSMASAGFAACMGASPETVLQAAEIGIEHNLGLTCDPIDGLVQVPCIERNSLGAVKAVTAAQLSLASDGVYSVTLDEAIEAMRLTAADMSVKYKETSLSGLATTVKIPLTVPAC